MKNRNFTPLGVYYCSKRQIMKRLGVIILFVCGLSLAGSAQNKTFLKVDPTTLFNELDVYIARDLSPSMSVELGGGFIFTDYWDNILNQIDFGQIKPNISEHQYLNAKGYATRLGIRFYVISPQAISSKARGTYFEPVLLFKEVWYPNNKEKIDEENYVNKGKKYVSGLQLLVGRQYKKEKVYIDKYIGLGVKAKTYRFDDFQMDHNTGDVENTGTRTTSWLPSIQLGIKIAFDLSRR